MNIPTPVEYVESLVEKYTFAMQKGAGNHARRIQSLIGMFSGAMQRSCEYHNQKGQG